MDQRNIAPHNTTEHSAHSASSTSILIAEVGTAITKLTLVDLVDGAFRLIARAEAPSTLDPPDDDAMLAVRQLITTIEGITGRAFEHDALRVPGGASSQPYQFVMTTSAAGTPRVAIMALAPSSAREAVNAARGMYSTIVHTFSLDEAGVSDEHWLSEQMAELSRAKPDVILLAGGLEHGALLPVERLAQLTGLLIRSIRPIPWVLYAGNSSAAERVRAAIGDVTVVANLRPTAISNRLEPARTALRAFYAQQRVPMLPGYEAFESLVATSVTTVADSQGVMVRFLAERYARRIVFLDTGATHSTGHMQANGHFTQVILAGQGTGQGAPTLLGYTGASSLERWLPFPAEQTNIANRLFNRAIHGSTVPIDGAELLLDHALLRESFLNTLQAMRSARTTMEFDLVIAAGAITRAPRPGLAVLTLLDVLALDNYYGTLAIDLYLDHLGLFAASGALAHLDPDAAACLLEQDAVNSGPLATLLVPQGKVVEGSAALSVELTSTSADGVAETHRATVQGGQIVRLPLPRGARGTLRIEPVADVYIGTNAPGAEVTTDAEAIIGSTVGVIIDARLRPLRLPTEDAARIACLRAWMEALDALPEDLVEQDVLTSASVSLTPEAETIDTVHTELSSPSLMIVDEVEPIPHSDDALVLVADADVSHQESSDDTGVLVAEADYVGDVSVGQSRLVEPRRSRVYDVSAIAVASTGEPDDHATTPEIAPAVAIPDLLADEPQSAVEVLEEASIDTSDLSTDSKVDLTASTFPEDLEAAIMEPVKQDTPTDRPGHDEPSHSEDASPSLPSEELASVEANHYPRSIAVMKDDAPTNEAQETPRKKRRFLWW